MKKIRFTLKKAYLTIGIFFIISFYSTNALSLGWADQEWISSGCPSNIKGFWKSRSSPDEVPHSMKITKGMISLDKIEGEKKTFFYNGSKFIKQARFLQLNLKDNLQDTVYSSVWKIRPHLTWKSSKIDTKTNCLIKTKKRPVLIFIKTGMSMKNIRIKFLK